MRKVELAFVSLLTILILCACGMSSTEEPLLETSGSPGSQAVGVVSRELDVIEHGHTENSLVPLFGSTDLTSGDCLHVHDGGAGRLDFGDDMLVRLFNDTRLDEIRAELVEGVPLDVQMFLVEGGITGRLTSAGGEAIVRTPGDAEINILGTLFFIVYNPNEDLTVVGNFDGTVDVTFDGSTESLQPGYYVELPAGHEPRAQRPIRESIARFEQRAIELQSPIAAAEELACENNLEVVRDQTIPHGTLLQPGEPFNKSWRVRNSGSCDWTEEYVLQFFDGESMTTDMAVPLDQTILSGESGTLSVAMDAPRDPGDHYGLWRLVSPDDEPFGQPLEVVIAVSDMAEDEPQPSITPGRTPSQASTPTRTPGATSEPTRKPTSRPSPTPTGQPPTPTPTLPPPTWTPTPTPTEPPPPPEVRFPPETIYADARCGDCRELYWETERVDALILNGDSAPLTGSLDACISSSDIYELESGHEVTELHDFRAEAPGWMAEHRTEIIWSMPEWWFSVDEDGDCADLRWYVAQAEAVYLNGELVGNEGSRTVCPAETQTYVLEADIGCGWLYDEVVFTPPISELPDLVVDSIWIDSPEIPYGAEPWTWVHFNVHNVGGGSSPEESIYLRCWANGSPCSGHMAIDGSLDPGASREHSFAVGHDDVWPPGEYELFVEVDYESNIEESDEYNNDSATITFVVEEYGPDDDIGSGCDGTEVEGYCWYFGADSASCDAVCDAHGGYHEATSFYAGSDGSPGGCLAVLESIALPIDEFFETTQGGLGCFAIQNTSGNYFGYWDSQPTSSSAVYGLPGRHRICACQQ